MITDETLRGRLPIGGLGLPLHVLPSVGSTNDVALGLAEAGAPEGTLVVADMQTHGRGRSGQAWQTRPGTALAMSLVLRPQRIRPETAWGISVAGALAVVDALETEGAAPSVKWPNDVLLGERKAAGVLVDASWEGERLCYAVLGIGVNVLAGSAPPDDRVDFPATSLEHEVGRAVDRGTLLLATLESLARWYARLGTAGLREAWWQRMAFRDRRVSVWDGRNEVRGRLTGLGAGGGVILVLEGGERVTVDAGAARLRPIDRATE
jgi:BirA family transcriptional regulator, biotin operon repressor / biotin---[acetyl-CoA-carboxylase] ligase